VIDFRIPVICLQCCRSQT